jgi:tetratricopeptide (TPR) repeat protein
VRRGWRGALLPVAIVSLAAAPGARGAPASVAEVERIARRVVAIPEETRFDREGMIDRFLAALSEERASPLVDLILHRIDEIDGTVRRDGLLERTYSEILREGTGSPWTADRIREALAWIYRRRGRIEEARRLVQHRSSLAHWHVIGPFGRPQAELHDWMFPPEREIDLSGRYPGMIEEVGWKRLERPVAQTFVSAFLPLYPWEGCVYALNQFHSDTARDAIVVFSPARSAKLWLNGALAVDADRARFDLQNTFHVPLRVRRGWNRILVKLSTSGHGSFAVRLVDPSGAPLPGVREEDESILRTFGPGEEGAREVFAPPPTALSILDEAAAAAEASPHVLAAHGWILLRNGFEARGLESLRAAAERAADSPIFLSYYGAALQSAPHLPPGYRSQRARDAYERAHRLDPDFLPPLLWLASFAESDERAEEAISILRRASDVSPRSHLPHLLLAGTVARRNWQQERLESLEAARRLAPELPPVLNAIGTYWLENGNPSRAIDAFEASLRSNAIQPETRGRLAELYQARGAIEHALQIYRRYRQDDPDEDLDIDRTIASLERDSGRIDRAVAAYLELSKRYPRYSSFKKQIADLHVEKGDLEEARSWYRRALDVDPGFHPVREILRRLEGGEDPEFKAYEVDALALLRQAPDASRFPRATSLAVLDDLVIRFYEDGSNRRITHQLFKIQSERGVEKHATFHPGEELLDLKVIRPDGSVLEPITLPAERGLTLPGLGIGAAVEWRHADTNRWPPGVPVDVPTFYFQDVDFDEPFLWSRYVVIQPRSLDLRHIVRNFPGEPEVRDLEDGRTRVTIYQVHNREIVKKEPFMPDPREILPQVTLSQDRTWKDLNQLYKRVTAFRLTPDLERAARQATRGVSGDRARAEKLYDFVNETVRDPAGSANPTAVLLERKGSRLALYRALLRAAAIPYEDARCRVSPGLDAEDPQWDWVREALYPQPILRVLPRDGEPVWVWLDVRDLPFGRLPFFLSEAPVFVQDGGEGRRETLPRLRDEEFLSADSTSVIRSEDAGHVVELTLRMPSFAGFPLKEMFRTLEVERRRQLGASMMSQFFPGSTLRSIELPALDEGGAPMELHAVAGLRRFAESRAGELGCRTGIQPLRLAPRFSSGEHRTWPIVFRDVEHSRSRVTIHLGSRYRVKRLPVPLEIDDFLGRYRLACREEAGGAIVVEREVAFDPVRIPVERYESFLAWCRAIDEREEERILLEEVE